MPSGALDDSVCLLDLRAEGVRIDKAIGKTTDLVHVFVTRPEALQGAMAGSYGEVGPGSKVVFGLRPAA